MEIKNRKIYSYIDQNKLKIEEIIKDFSNYVYTIIRKSYINLPNEDIEEILLDVFFTVWHNQDKLDINKSMSAYIGGITKNLIKKKYRNIKKTDNIYEYENQLIDLSNIEMLFVEDEKRKIMFNQIEKLKKEDKEVFIKYYYEEKSISEIAKIYNMSESRIKSKLFRIRKKLKKHLKERGYEF